MKSKKTIVGLVGFLSFLLTSASLVHASPADTLPLAISIQDENGASVSDTHLFIFSNENKQLALTREVGSRVNIDLPPGDYRIYAAMTKKQENGYIEYYASPESTLSLSLRFCLCHSLGPKSG